MWESMADATPPWQMQSSTDHKNSTTIQVYNPQTGTKQRQLRQVPGFEHL
jgi:hypothetical protein